jgi:hypothetical protein
MVKIIIDANAASIEKMCGVKGCKATIKKTKKQLFQTLLTEL